MVEGDKLVEGVEERGDCEKVFVGGQGGWRVGVRIGVGVRIYWLGVWEDKERLLISGECSDLLLQRLDLLFLSKQGSFHLILLFLAIALLEFQLGELLLQCH